MEVCGVIPSLKSIATDIYIYLIAFEVEIVRYPIILWACSTKNLNNIVVPIILANHPPYLGFEVQPHFAIGLKRLAEY